MGRSIIVQQISKYNTVGKKDNMQQEQMIHYHKTLLGQKQNYPL